MGNDFEPGRNDRRDWELQREAEQRNREEARAKQILEMLLDQATMRVELRQLIKDVAEGTRQIKWLIGIIILAVVGAGMKLVLK